MSKKQNTKFITPDILKGAVKGAFIKLNPRYMMKNPVMFVVEIGFFITLLLSFVPGLFGDANAEQLRIYDIIVCAILFVTVLFANFAEAVAEGRGKAQAASLKKTQKDTQAHLLHEDGTQTIVSSSELKKGDVVLVSAGEIIPNDGEVIEGIASVDESAITGESAPVVRESGGDFCSVTGGTTVVSDWLKIRITSEPGNSFLDRMIALVEGASRKKTPNEIALNTLLVSLTIIFLIVVVTMYPFAVYNNVQIPISTLIALLVCLIPTTIGGLLSAIGIAGMDRVTRFNVIAMSGKAVEACGDVDTMILDKTGTITYGNRLAADFYPVGGASKEELIRCAVLTSLRDGTPEGKSTVELGRKLGCQVEDRWRPGIPAFRASHGGFCLTAQDERGAILDSSQLLALVALIEMENGSGRLAVPSGASAAVDLVAAGYDGTVLRLDRDGKPARDLYAAQPWFWSAPSAAARICARMGVSGQKLDALISKTPRFSSWRREVPLSSDRGRVMEAMVREQGRTCGGEGLRVHTGGGWVYLVPLARRSALRVVGEGPDLEIAAELCDFYAGRAAQLDRAISEQCAQGRDKK